MTFLCAFLTVFIIDAVLFTPVCQAQIETTNATERGSTVVVEGTKSGQSGGSRDMSRLLKDLFAHYNPLIPPRTNISKPIEVEFGLGIQAVIALDTQTQVLELRGYAVATWTDAFLQWDPQQYGNISEFMRPQNSVWKPDIGLLDSLDENMYFGTDEDTVTISSNGRIDWQPQFLATLYCQVDIVKLPLDVNVCPIRIGPWLHGLPVVVMNIMEPPYFFWSEVFVNGVFIIESLPPKKSCGRSASSLDNHQELVFYLQLSRRPQFEILSQFLPMVIIGLLCPLSFLVHPCSNEKATIALNILLSTVVSTGVLREDLPARSGPFSSIGLYSTWVLVSSFISVFGNILVILVAYLEKERREREAAHHEFVLQGISYVNQVMPNNPAEEIVPEETPCSAQEDITDDQPQLDKEFSREMPNRADKIQTSTYPIANRLNKTFLGVSILCFSGPLVYVLCRMVI